MMKVDKKIVKAVDPQENVPKQKTVSFVDRRECGFILNDNDAGVDHLDQSAYAEAIAESIHQVETPITIGLFARWGCGKSFLVKHILSSLKKIQRQGELDNAQSEENRVKTTKSFCSAPSFSMRWFLGIVMIIILAALLIFCLVIAIQPGILLGNSESAAGDAASTTPAMVETTTISEELTREHTATTLRYIGVGLMIFVILATMLVTCCSQWVSKSYYGQVKLLMYALFTKIPITKDTADYIIGDPGEPDSSLLKRATPDEVLAAASVSNSVFPRKYIFVNFRAWEFAGSERIWAGIVTNLASAIETEFGIVTARLFRTTNFEQLSPAQMLRNEERSKVIYVDLAHVLSKDGDGVLRVHEVKDAMKEYGVVRECENMSNKINWWRIEFAEPAEARNAVDCLKIQGLKVEREVEDDRPSFDRRARERESSRPLLGEGGDDNRVEDVIEPIEMETMESAPTPNLPYQPLEKPPEPVETEFARQDGRCGRFCGHWSRHPTMLCCCPYLMWMVLVFIIVIILPLSLYIFADVFHLETARTFWGVSPYAQTLLWLPGGLSVVVFGMKFIWSMCNSQRSRVTRALNGTKSSMSTELGFMRKVKDEVAIMTKLIKCARFVFRRDYKVVISVDDVDRVPLDKVKSVLEAVNILLSDRSSPFICLIAVDSRVAVKCIEQSLGEDLVKANVTGYEYLKKIINLPVCLPEVENVSKRRFIAGLIDQADHTTTTRKVCADAGKPKPKKKKHKKADYEDTYDGEASAGESEEEEEHVEPTMDGKEFMFACREFIYNNDRLHRYMNGSPRNIKRIFNVISLTGCIIRQQLAQAKRRKLLDRMQYHHDTSIIEQSNNYTLPSTVGEIDCNQTLVKDLVHWIVISDQWAFRASYILQVIEDSDQRVEAGDMSESIPDTTSLYDIYTMKVLPELYLSQSSLLSLDNDADVLVNYLLYIRDTGLNKGRTRQMSAWTINLDRSIRQTIAHQREMVVIKKAKNETIV